MANATFSVYLATGGVDGTPGADADVDALGPPTIKYKNADNSTIDSNDKITIPGAGSVYSYWKTMYLKCDANADVHTINNLKIYSDGTNTLDDGGGADSIDVNIGEQFPTKNSGSTAGYEVANNANEFVAEHGGINSAVSIFTLNSGAALALSISEAGNIINAANETSNYFITQCEIKSDASAGATANETGTISYDEA